MPKDETLHSGFVSHDYVLTFSIADAAQRAALVALCRGPWQGDEVTAHTWEISNDLSPDALESAVVPLLGPDDRAAYYYLSDSKRMFRVVLR
ncbi:MAG: hypothetical protein HY908_01970 [Myxococcales bacterium]|nr:hypothetical protein [Myxococcales bacterium]